MMKWICVVMIASLLAVAQAQRPAFAGMRPPGGLSQKDKYHATQNTAVENITGVDIVTRFGEPSPTQQTPIINLAHGAVQRPPIGVPLVLPISAYVPDTQPSRPAVPTVVNRFGEADASSPFPTAGAPFFTASSPVPTAGAPIFSASSGSGSGSSSSSPVPAASAPAPIPAANPSAAALPIDAHGDQEYVNHLSTLPVENQPFWFINYQHIEALRNSSRPNVGALETRGSFFGG
ncbi:translation initiation factor IF-2 [Drosophila miranda]|uniref:translation initiation factor IF-2 n=1 Tax=Drosophila miranda TaxID=7229 RepID=UPI0007E81CE7|nr:translation initiation factor IF-2 [Drosophila miranda]